MNLDVLQERYLYHTTSKEQTGFAVFSCTDTRTGIVVRTPLASPDRSYPAFIAYIGAKFSRSRLGMVDLMGEVEQAYQEGRLVPEKRLAGIVQGLKHQSPGGMAHVVVSIENIPILTAAAIFRRTTLHDGQEASTRYIDFASGNDLPQLSTLLPEGAQITPEDTTRYMELQDLSLQYYLKWFPIVYEAYKKHFNVATDNKSDNGALTARAYDTVRGFLLSGFKTSMVYVTNATTMQQLISDMANDRLPGEGQLAAVLKELLAPKDKINGYSPEISPLLNHIEPNFKTQQEQTELKTFFSRLRGFKELLSSRRSFSGLVDNNVNLIPSSVSPTDRIIAQHILVVHPSLNFEAAVKFAATLTDADKAEVGRIIFSRRDRFNLPAMASSGSTLGLSFGIDLGIERDLGRHRAWERVSPIHETYVGQAEISQTGFTQAAYLAQIPEFAAIQQGMETDMNHFYDKRAQFLANLNQKVGQEAVDRVGMYLLPLAHQVDMVMNGDVRNLVHLQDIRIREGAHIDARRVIASANQQIAQSDPLYRSLMYPQDRVKVDDRTQFLSRD